MEHSRFFFLFLGYEGTASHTTAMSYHAIRERYSDARISSTRLLRETCRDKNIIHDDENAHRETTKENTMKTEEVLL